LAGKKKRGNSDGKKSLKRKRKGMMGSRGKVVLF
jgi:hypothetical protein